MTSNFSSLTVKGFRRLRDAQLGLSRLNVLIGANGVGKSSVLQVLRLLAASAGGGLQKTISLAYGVDSLITQGEESFTFSLEMSNPDESPVVYDLQVEKRDQGYSIVLESLRQFPADPDQNPLKYIESHRGEVRYCESESCEPVRPAWQHQVYETALFQAPTTLKLPQRFRRLLGSTTLYHLLDISPRAPVRAPQPIQPTLLPGVNGERLVSCLYSFQENEPDRFDAIMDTLKAAFPTFEKVDLSIGEGLLSLAWTDSNCGQPLFAHQLSEGVLRFLWLVTLLESPNLPAITMIDQPEVSLHPEIMGILAELMREAAQRTQLIVATNCDRLVRHLRPEELVICDVDDCGGSKLTRGSELDLKEWLKNYRLDELWSLGRLGGRA